MVSEDTQSPMEGLFYKNIIVNVGSAPLTRDMLMEAVRSSFPSLLSDPEVQETLLNMMKETVQEQLKGRQSVSSEEARRLFGVMWHQAEPQLAQALKEVQKASTPLVDGVFQKVTQEFKPLVFEMLPRSVETWKITLKKDEQLEVVFDKYPGSAIAITVSGPALAAGGFRCPDLRNLPTRWGGTGSPAGDWYFEFFNNIPLSSTAQGRYRLSPGIPQFPLPG